MAQQINEQFKAQWEKPMFSFYDYLPTKYEASKAEWKVRKLIWDFKDGKRKRWDKVKLVVEWIAAIGGLIALLIEWL